MYCIQYMYIVHSEIGKCISLHLIINALCSMAQSDHETLSFVASGDIGKGASHHGWYLQCSTCYTASGLREFFMNVEPKTTKPLKKQNKKNTMAVAPPSHFFHSVHHHSCSGLLLIKTESSSDNTCNTRNKSNHFIMTERSHRHNNHHYHHHKDHHYDYNLMTPSISAESGSDSNPLLPLPFDRLAIVKMLTKLLFWY